MEAIDGISKSFLALLARQLAEEKEEKEDEEEEEEEELPSLHSQMEELVSVNQSLLEALDLSHPALQQVGINFEILSITSTAVNAYLLIYPNDRCCAS